MEINLNIEISEEKEFDHETEAIKEMLLKKLKKKEKLKIMEDGPFPLRGTGLSATVSPGITPFTFPFLDDD